MSESSISEKGESGHINAGHINFVHMLPSQENGYISKRGKKSSESNTDVYVKR